MRNTEYLSTRNLRKQFGSVLAVDSVSMRINRGEIHCLLGENGAGKSTLSECLYGFYKPDSGQIFLSGKPVTFDSPGDAIKAGIGMVHQHFVLVPTFSVLENIVLGTSMNGWSSDLSSARRRIAEICDLYGIVTDLNAKVWQLSVGEQQWVELLKALYIGAELLILDEPTAVLTPQESDRLFAILRRMTDNGLAVVLISHKLNEVLRSDRVTVLRRGKQVGTVETRNVTKQDLVSMMVGREVSLQQKRMPRSPGNIILSIKDLVVRGDRGTESVCRANLDVRAGEILGIAGVAGNGQKELFESIIGARRIEQGEVRLNDQSIANFPPSRVIELGIGYIPDDRYRAGLVAEFDIEENLIIGLQKRREFSRNGFLDFSRIASFAQKAIDDFGIVAKSSRARAETLSGGNAQKIILAREMWSSTCCLLANQPTRGLDVGVIEYVHKILLKKRSEGFGILLASEELDDILSLSDRIAVMFKGRVMGVFQSEDVTIEQLGMLMAGNAEALH